MTPSAALWRPFSAEQRGGRRAKGRLENRRGSSEDWLRNAWIGLAEVPTLDPENSERELPARRSGAGILLAQAAARHDESLPPLLQQQGRKNLDADWTQFSPCRTIRLQ